MRVVYIDHVARLSGGELALLGLIRAVQGEVDPHVILGEEGPLAVRLREEGVAVEILPLDPRLRDVRRAKLLDLRPLAALPGYVLRLRRRIREIGPDVVHTNSLKAALYGGLAARLAGVPLVWHVRDRISDDYLPSVAARMMRLAARWLPDAVVANSRATLATLPRARRGSVVYNAVEPPWTGPGDKRNSLTVGIVGRLAPWKGQDVFIDAFARAFAGSDVRGRIVGGALFGEEEFEQGLRQRAAGLGVAEQVEFRGFRDPVWGELAEIDVLVHASTVPEPFGQVVLEGMAAGLAVVAMDAAGPAELIGDGEDGLLVPPGDPGALAAALERLRDDRELRKRLGTNARRRAAEFTPARTAAAMLEIYAAVARRG